MDINYIWSVIEPFFLAFGGTAMGGVIVGAICRLLQGKLLQRLDENSISKKVAEKLGNGMTIGIDLTAVTEKKLDKINTALTKRVEIIQAETASIKPLLTAVGKAVLHLKALTEEEKQALQDAITALDNTYSPPVENVDKITTVKLEPIALAEEQANEPETKSLINFGGLES